VLPDSMLPDSMLPDPEVLESEDYQLVEQIADVSAQIAGLEAQRLRLIARLHARECMRPLPAPAAAQSRAGRGHRSVRDLRP